VAARSADRPRRSAGRPAKPLDPSASEIALLGYQLRRRRKSRQMTLAVLAERTGYSVQHIGAVERGEAVPSAGLVAACDEVLETGRQLTGLLPAVIREQAARRNERQAQRRATPSIARQDRQTRYTWQGVDLDQLAALAQQTSAPTRRVVENDLQPITARHRSLYHELTSAELEASVTSHVRLLTTLLANATDATMRPLASAVGETAGLAAWLYADLGDQPRSKQMYRVAETALSQGEDWALSAYVHGFRASVLLEGGQRQRGLSELDVADAQGGGTGPPMMMSWLAALRAHASAGMGDHSAARAALQRADTELDRAEAGRGAEWMYGFDQGRLAGYRGACFLWQRKGKPAAEAIKLALATLPPSCARRRAELTLDLAYARLFDGEITEAAHNAGAALDTLLACGSIPGLRRISRFHTRLIRDGHRAAAASLDARLPSVLARPDS
jgi:transcriptional regulator with XRE-family HTH domain